MLRPSDDGEEGPLAVSHRSHSSPIVADIFSRHPEGRETGLVRIAVMGGARGLAGFKRGQLLTAGGMIAPEGLFAVEPPV